MDRGISVCSVNLHTKSASDYFVGVPIFGRADLVGLCIDSVDAHTPESVEIVLWDDGTRDPALDVAIERKLEAMSRPWTWVVNLRNEGFVRTANKIMRLDRRNVILLNSDTEVTANWAVELNHVAQSHTSVATVTATTNEGTIASLAFGERFSTRASVELATVAAFESEHESAWLPTCVGHCVLVMRRAIDLVGLFDESLGRGYAEEVEFSQRCLLQGLIHLLATDATVFHHGGASFNSVPGVKALKAGNEAKLVERYAYYPRLVEDSFDQVRFPGMESSRSTMMRFRALQRLGVHVGLDCRMVGQTHSGTRRLVEQLALSLAASPELRGLTLYVPAHMAHFWAETFANIDAVPVTIVVCTQDTVRSAQECDIVIRPTQLERQSELALLLSAAPRWHLHVLDGIAYDNPGYHRDVEDFIAYRRLQEWSFAHADAITFNSSSVQSWMKTVGISRPDGSVIWNGTDHFRSPQGISRGRASGPFRLLSVGAAFKHKNRVFCLRVAEELLLRGHDVSLTLVGPAPDFGSSLVEEQREWIRIQERVSALRAMGVAAGSGTLETLLEVDDEGLQKRFHDADCLLYPSSNEGFGLVPFEAAHAGLAVLSSSGGSLQEVIPEEAILTTFGVADWADRVQELRRNPRTRQLCIDALKKRSLDFTWNDTAGALLEVAIRALERPRAGYSQVSLSPIHFSAEQELRSEVDSLRRRILEAASEIGGLKSDLERLHESNEGAETALISANSELDRIYRSKRWNLVNRWLAWVGK